MPREGLEVADVFRHFGAAFRERYGASLSGARRRAMIAIEGCRTAALGGHEGGGDLGGLPASKRGLHPIIDPGRGSSG